jgi:ubiquinone/menaquinone biosynthesis C-methylase UbiE
MNLQNKFYPESCFGGFSDIDGTIAFYTRVNALLQPSSVLLDVGCGRGVYAEDGVPLRQQLRIFKGKCQRVIGLDVDEAARANPYLDEFHLIADEEWPVTDGSVDICIADFVIEHISDPDKFFAQCQRVLKPQGVLCLRTPNLYNYVGFISRLVPNHFHAAVLSKAQKGRKEEDIFPTLYKCNSKRKLSRVLRSHGFDAHVYGYESEPAYLSFSRVAYALGVMHQRLAPNVFKAALFAFARKE